VKLFTLYLLAFFPFAALARGRILGLKLSYRRLLSMRLPPVHARLLCFAAIGSLGCAAGAAKTAAPDDASNVARVAPGPSGTAGFERIPATEQPSVKPGINDPYFRDDGLDRYTRILESETREIAQRRSDIVDAIGLDEGMFVADIGAGTGLLTMEIAKQVGERGMVFAVDIVPAFLERIRERARAEGLPNVIAVRGEERATGLEPASLDLAFMCDTYHHIEYPVAYMRSVFETLRPGAALVLVDMKRPEGQSSPAVLRHVRADKSTVIAEVEQAGFLFESERNLLEENYYLYFRHP
jgi:ubiquinone/menaquinone biosynthesis C-methylase UbiE